ncbi:MAG: NfeD family protein [Gammaproteobacteria bacterium]|nr:NfeD family protein [Gammaproteobacteria bacterium]
MQMEFWYWWVIGLVLLVAETFVPGAIFLWMGVAAGITGAALFLAPEISIETQLLIFSVISVVSVVVWRVFLHKEDSPTDQPSLNQRSAQYIGRTFTLSEAIENGVGTVTVDDSRWNVRGSDMAAGSKVKVTAVDGVILIVEATE